MELNRGNVKVGTVLYMRDDCSDGSRFKWVVLKTPWKFMGVFNGPSWVGNRLLFRGATLSDTLDSDAWMSWMEVNSYMSLRPSPTAVVFKCLRLLPEHEREVLAYLVSFRKP